jgi:DNA-directed RNA polymerase specialized sigma24 family protein
VRTEVADGEIARGLLGTDAEQAAAIDRAYNRYAEPLAQFIREKVAPTLDPHEVKTAVNDTFLGLAKYAARRKFMPDGSLATLLFTMARRKACDQWRQKAAHQRHYVDCTRHEEDVGGDGLKDEDVASLVAHRLGQCPEIAAMWRTAVEECAANEIIRLFRLWIGSLPRLQRKVAEVLSLHFGDITNEEICDEIAKTGERPPVASIKSARKEITQKFTTFIEKRERTTKP